jgi:CBS domain-containing protein
MRAMLAAMTVGELCIREVVIVREDETVVDAAKVMREHHVGDVIVIRESGGERQPVGIVTDRDLVVEVLAQAVDKATTLLVKDVATQPIATVRESEPVERALDEMLHRGIRRVPVVDGHGALMGIVTYDDLLDLFAGQLARLAGVPSRQTVIESDQRS